MKFTPTSSADEVIQSIFQPNKSRKNVSIQIRQEFQLFVLL